MSGFPLPLRLDDLERVCRRYDDPEGVRWRVMLLEEKALAFRRAQYQFRRAQYQRRKT